MGTKGDLDTQTGKTIPKSAARIQRDPQKGTLQTDRRKNPREITARMFDPSSDARTATKATRRAAAAIIIGSAITLVRAGTIAIANAMYPVATRPVVVW